MGGKWKNLGSYFYISVDKEVFTYQSKEVTSRHLMSAPNKSLAHKYFAVEVNCAAVCWEWKGQRYLKSQGLNQFSNNNDQAIK